jgi:hypothetical protein
MMPEPGEWNSAVEHSTENPSHILGPYDGEDGIVHMDCSTCGFDTADHPHPVVVAGGGGTENGDQ